jgi:hypothetical protein
MRFSIEIIRNDGEVVYRGAVDEMSSNHAKTKAAALVNLYAGRGATGARVLNEKGQELHTL